MELRILKSLDYVDVRWFCRSQIRIPYDWTGLISYVKVLKFNLDLRKGRKIRNIFLFVRRCGFWLVTG